MPIYTYKYQDSDEELELFQSIHDDELVKDPSTGRLVNKVLSTGAKIQNKGLSRSTQVNKLCAAATACGCGKGLNG